MAGNALPSDSGSRGFAPEPCVPGESSSQRRAAFRWNLHVSDRDKTSSSDSDKRRREKPRRGGNGRSRSEGGKRGARRVSGAYKRRVEEQLFGKRNDAGRSRLEQRLRDAHASPTFLRTYREFKKSFGMPEQFGLLLMLLDLEDERELLGVLQALGEAVPRASVDERSLLRSRMRNLEMSASTDALGNAALELLGRL